MRHKKIIFGLFAATTLVGVAAQSPRPAPHVRLTSSTTQHDDHMTLSATEIQPGGTIRVSVQSSYTLSSECGGDATSPGFVAPITLGMASHTIHSGEGLVITKPGVYKVTVPCSSGSPLTQSFTIVGAPTTSQPTNPPANPPTKIVKPVGAPQTGGGGTS